MHRRTLLQGSLASLATLVAGPLPAAAYGIRIAVTPLVNRGIDFIPPEIREEAAGGLVHRLTALGNYDVAALSFADYQDLDDILNDVFSPDPAWGRLRQAMDSKGLNVSRALIPVVSGIHFTGATWEDRHGSGRWGRTMELRAGGTMSLTLGVRLIDFATKRNFDWKQTKESKVIGPISFETADCTTTESPGGILYLEALIDLLTEAVRYIQITGL